tara:strand:+ start:31988 stop:32467 length:480 start_codon:yes stop_codon:yes gene_type:complete
MKKAIYSGSFDPFTKGHEDILRRSLRIFDEVTILIAVSPSKKPLFTVKERAQMISELFENEKQVKVDSWEGLIIDYAKNNQIQTIVRGLRPTGDFEIEFQMASMNNHLYPKIETIFLPTSADQFYVSSSLVKEILKHGGDIKDFLPQTILKNIKKVSKE